MTKQTKLCILLGCLLIAVAIFLRATRVPLVMAQSEIKASSFLILANIAFVLAVLFKK